MRQKVAGSPGQFRERGAERRGRRGQGQHFDARAKLLERVQREIDPVETAVILAAILQMIDDLQGRAKRVIETPGCAGVFAVNVQHEAPDRHRRIAAVIDEIVPVLIAKLRHVAAEGGHEIAGVPEGKPTLPRYFP